jgi:RIO kinase 1
VSAIYYQQKGRFSVSLNEWKDCTNGDRTNDHIGAEPGAWDEYEQHAEYAEQYAELYASEFDPLRHDRQAHRRRKPEARHAKKRARDIVAELAETEGLEGGFETTYQPSVFERGWLLESLRSFYERGLIVDVLAQIKGGKEASVYRCRAHPRTGLDMVAAKVYRPRRFRHLRNDALYRRGRETLTSDGNVVKKTDHRIMRALGKKTAFGQQVAHTSWLMYEYTTMEHLHEAGGAVPRPLGADENAILMAYMGDDAMPAPTLNTVRLDPDEAERHWLTVRQNIELLLRQGLIHGDLSPYNILYWQNEVVLIDFPQVVQIEGNTASRRILARDIQRVTEYFQAQGVRCNADALLEEMWSLYGIEYPRLPDDWDSEEANA